MLLQRRAPLLSFSVHSAFSSSAYSLYEAIFGKSRRRHLLSDIYFSHGPRAAAPISLNGTASTAALHNPLETAHSMHPPAPRFASQPQPQPSALQSSLLSNPLELKLLCTELDSKGHIHMRRGRFSRAYLCSSLGLQPRDLRRLDSVSACNGSRKQLPTLLVRPQTILLSCEFVRAVIRRDRVLFFEGDQGTSPSAGSPLDRSIEGSKEQILHSLLVRELQSKLKATQTASEASDATARGTTAAQPFEFIVIETILQSVLQSLQDEFDLMAPPIESHLTLLERFIHWDRLRTLLECKKRVASFHERITHLRGCLAELLESDADMAAMYLTEGAERREPRPSWAHEEMELLLESYLKLAEETVSRVQLLAANIHSTEDIVNIGLVGQRNELLLLELKLGIGTFAASMGGFGAALLGMNLTNGWEAEGSAAFWAVAVTLGSVATVAFTASWRRMLKLIRKY